MIIEKIFANVFEPLASYDWSAIYAYADSKQNFNIENDNINWAIMESIKRFARLMIMTDDLLEE